MNLTENIALALAGLALFALFIAWLFGARKLCRAIFLALTVAFFLAPRMKAQVTPTKPVQLTNFPPQLNANSQSNLFTIGTIPTNNVFPVTQGGGMSYQITWNGANSADTLPAGVEWAGTTDGSNYFPLPSSFLLGNGNGLGPASVGTNLPGAVLNNLTFVTPYFLTNGNAHAITFTNAASGVAGATNGAFTAGIATQPLPYGY